MATWKIAYTIEDGEHEYGDYFTCELAAESLDADATAELVAGHWQLLEDWDAEEHQDFLEHLKKEGYAFLPWDGRRIKELGWEKVVPIVVTIRENLVEGVTGLPDGITLEVQDWDNGELDSAGEPVPTVSEWTGPL